MTIISAPTWAQAGATSSSSISDILSIFFSLLVVIGVIFSVAYVMRRFNVTQASSKNMNIVASMMTGAREKIMVIQVGEEQHLIGVTSQNINHLAKLETQIETQEASSPTHFKQTLVKAMAEKMNPNLKSKAGENHE